MTTHNPATLAAAAKRLGGKDLRRSPTTGAWWLLPDDELDGEHIGSDADLCDKLEATMPLPRSHQANLRGRIEKVWVCTPDWKAQGRNFIVRLAPKKLDVWLACVAAMDEAKEQGNG